VPEGIVCVRDGGKYKCEGGRKTELVSRYVDKQDMIYVFELWESKSVDHGSCLNKYPYRRSVDALTSHIELTT
jgi:hypothetical protein